ncbi:MULTISPECIES: restriction endonuclease [unclassified Helicobacter]|uniref:restriction endonuclease n=1 Tax=unclassified Helicobacter TaxID=2593540 RepID=UPI000CF01C24|nr:MULTISPECIES: restriction endonuclease [unclassified Helicobacter]
MKHKIIDFLNQFNYDIRISQNARWIDQKCTPDVLSIICDCILQYTNYDTNVEFSIKDIWKSPYAKENVVAIFSKPYTDSESAKNEYDKFFSQPIKLLEYSKILVQTRKKNKALNFKISYLEILEFIMKRDTNSLVFLLLYIKKVLQDSGIYHLFEDFLDKQDKQSFIKLKDHFCNFISNNTPINTKTEASRIFTKVLNPLAFENKKKGTRKGNLSKTIITLDELQYNRINWRDLAIDKDKTITRKEYSSYYPYCVEAQIKYNKEKAMRIVRRYNELYNDGLSEVRQEDDRAKATQIHHIFPSSMYPTISDFIENLIALTPNQHFILAHPNNNTKYIDKDFQYICLIAKTNTIMQDKTNTYNFSQYKIVLNTGLNTKEFDLVNDFDFVALIKKIDIFYSDFKKYENLYHQNVFENKC